MFAIYAIFLEQESLLQSWYNINESYQTLFTINSQVVKITITEI